MIEHLIRTQHEEDYQAPLNTKLSSNIEDKSIDHNNTDQQQFIFNEQSFANKEKEMKWTCNALSNNFISYNNM